jgi:hypothetical protein
MRIHSVFLVPLLAVAACSGDGPTMPVAAAPSANAFRGLGSPPGSKRTSAAVAGAFVPLNCTPKQLATGSATIGPAGGVLQIGTHRLIVPAGALTNRVLISGTVPAGKPFEIDLQPHGLQFRKPAGLILDASSCVDVPTIVYIVDDVTLGPPIPAFYSNWWKAIACPIWHFSGYMIALGDNAESHEIGAQ